MVAVEIPRATRPHERSEKLAESSEPPSGSNKVMDESFTALTAQGLPVVMACRLAGRSLELRMVLGRCVNRC